MLPEDHKEVKWLLSFLKAKWTPWGQVIFGMILVGMAISAVGTQIAGYYFVSFVWALFLTASILSAFFKPRIRAERIMPSAPTAGELCFYRVIVMNPGRGVLRNIEIFDHKLPFGLYSVADHPQQKTSVDWLEPGQKVTLTVALRIPRRGSYVLGPLIAGTSFPTGLVRPIRRVTGPSPLIVLPRPARVPGLGFDLRSTFQAGGSQSAARFGLSNEFLSTREYREGDRPRDIHWNSSARMGKLIVKEYVDEYMIRAGILLDVQLGRFEKHRCFEAMISLTAGMAEEYLNLNYAVDLFLNDGRFPLVATGRGREETRHFFEMLSAVEGEERVDFGPALSVLEERRGGLSGLVVILKDWDPARAAFVAALREWGLRVLAVVLRDRPPAMPCDDAGVRFVKPSELVNAR